MAERLVHFNVKVVRNVADVPVNGHKLVNHVDCEVGFGKFMSGVKKDSDMYAVGVNGSGSLIFVEKNKRLKVFGFGVPLPSSVFHKEMHVLASSKMHVVDGEVVAGVRKTHKKEEHKAPAPEARAHEKGETVRA